MLCSKCGKNEATVHVCEIGDGRTTTSELCATCAPVVPPSGEIIHLQMHSPGSRSHIAKETIFSLIQDDNSALKPKENVVLSFIVACITKALTKGAKGGVQNPVHVRASEILAVAADVATELYGTGAREKLRTLGIVSSEALGQWVFRFIAEGILGKTADDRIEDFSVRSPLDEFMQAE